MSVTQHLLRFAVALVLPILIAVGIGLWRYADQESHRYTDQVRGHAIDLAARLDRELLALQAGLAAAADAGGDGLPPHRLVDRDGHPLAGAALAPAMAAAGRAAVAGERFVVSDLYRSEDGMQVAVAAPRRVDRHVVGAIVAAVPVDRFRSLIVAGGLPEGWAGAFVDGNGIIVARLTRHAEFAGQPATAAFRAAASGDTGNWEGVSQDHVAILGGFARSAVAGWYAATGVPKRIVFGPLRRSLLLLATFGTAALALAGGLAVIVARRIARPIEALADAARDLEANRFTGLAPTGVGEVDQVGSALAFAHQGIAAREAERAMLRQTEERLRLAQDAARIGIHDYDVASGQIRWDARTRALWSVGADVEIDYRLFRDSLHPDDRAAVEAAVARALDPASDGAYATEYRVIGIDDRVERWIAATGQVHRHDGQAVRLVGTVADISAEKAAAERERLLASEVEHRARNVLAIARSLIRQTPFEDHRQFVQAVEGRLAALDRVQSLLSRAHWIRADLRTLVAAELAAHGDRVSLDGPAVALSAATTQPLAMAIHELATNAAKYGALAAAAGRLTVTWARRADRSLLLTWQEAGGRPPAGGDGGMAPASAGGFGGKLIDLTIGRQLRGSITRVWSEDGLAVSIRLPEGWEATAGEADPPPADGGSATDGERRHG